VLLQQLGVEYVRDVIYGIPHTGGNHRTTNIKGMLAVGPGMAKILAFVALRKASLSSI
jgi:hypothetical protein